MERKRILVVDDNIDHRELLSVALQSAGFEVKTAAGAKEGIQAAHEELPDAVLADVNMPGLSGIDLLRALRASTLTCAIPIVFVSAGRPHQIAALAQSGATCVCKVSGMRAIVDAARSALLVEAV